jgi:hypothetical protein
MSNLNGFFNHSRSILNTIKPFRQNLKWMTIALLCVKVLFAQYSNATLSGPWFLYHVPVVISDDSLNYLVFDGNGHITTGNMFGFTPGTYSVTATGTISGMLMGAYPFANQLISSNFGIMSNWALSRIANPGALTDSLVGVISGTNITLHVNSIGEITSATGLTSPVSGNVYTDSGVFLGHLKTGGSGCWGEFSIFGTYANNSLVGTFSGDCNGAPGTVNLVRKGIASSIMKRGQTVSKSQQIICRNNGEGMFSISTRNIIAGNVKIQVMDLMGRNLAAQPIIHALGNYSMQVDLSKLSKGIYFIRLQSNKIIFQNKILIE